MLGVERHHIIDIGAKAQHLVRTGPLGQEFHGDKGGILHVDPAVFHRGGQPIDAVLVAAQDGGEQFDEGEAADGRPLVVPLAVSVDSHIKIATDVRDRAGTGRRAGRRGR